MKIKFHPICIAAATLLFIWASATYGESIEFSDKEKQILLSGKIIQKEVPTIGKPGKTFQAAGVINATVSNVYEVLTDFEKYHEFMPHNESTIVLERTERHAIVNITLGLPLNQYKKYRLSWIMEYDKNIAKIKWKKIEWPGLKMSETIKDTEGFWYISSFPEKAHHVLVVCHVYTDPGPIPFYIKWIADWMAKNSVPKMIIATKDRVDDLFGKK